MLCCTKGRAAQLTVGQMINVTDDELRIERRKTTELIVSCFRDLPKVPWSDFFSTLLGGAAGRVRVDRALASHPLLRAMWGCFKPPRCAADGVLRPTRAACPAGVEL